MTLTATTRIIRVKQFQAFMDAGSRPQDKRHGCRHPPPSARPNLLVERMSEGLIATLRSGLLKIGSMWLYVTPARLSFPSCSRPEVRLCFKAALVAG